MQWPAAELWHLAHKGSIRLVSQSIPEPNHVNDASAKRDSDPALHLRYSQETRMPVSGSETCTILQENYWQRAIGPKKQDSSHAITYVLHAEAQGPGAA